VPFHYFSLATKNWKVIAFISEKRTERASKEKLITDELFKKI
jgi:hypothetical protein